jgi:hypothetical protein
MGIQSEGVKWSGDTVTWYWAGGAGDWNNEVATAFALWDVNLSLHFVQVSSPDAANIVVTFGALDGPYNQVGYTNYSYNISSPYNILTKSTVTIDSGETWQWSAAANAYVLGSGVSFTEVVTHELGHALGLGHSDDPSSIMYPVLTTSIVAPSSSDLAYIEGIYGTASGGGGTGGGGNAPSTTVQQEIMGLYAALYGRAGEYPGYAFWVNSIGNGVTTANAASTPVSDSAATTLGIGFVTSQSTFFDKTYGNLTDSAFINAMYLNIGGATADPGGSAYWSTLLAKAEAAGLSVQAARAGLVGTFVEVLVEFNTASRPAGLTDQQWADALTRQNTIDNKIAVSLGYANASNSPGGSILDPHTPDDAAYAAATRALQHVTSDHQTVVTALANISSAVQHQDLMLI